MRYRTAQRAIFKGMEKAVQPARIGDFSGEVQYNLDGHLWVLRIADRQASAKLGRASNPVLTFHMSLATFARIAAGEILAPQALLERKIEVEGDVRALARFSMIFGDR